MSTEDIISDAELIKRLTATLEPFALLADEVQPQVADDFKLTEAWASPKAGDLRRAREALSAIRARSNGEQVSGGDEIPAAANDDPKALADRRIYAFDQMADAWAEEVDLAAMIKNATSPMDLKPHAPADVRAEFRRRMEAQIDAIARQCFLEGAVRASLAAAPTPLSPTEDNGSTEDLVHADACAPANVEKVIDPTVGKQ
jgi:hypothetical protein